MFHDNKDNVLAIRDDVNGNVEVRIKIITIKYNLKSNNNKIKTYMFLSVLLKKNNIKHLNEKKMFTKNNKKH